MNTMRFPALPVGDVTCRGILIVLLTFVLGTYQQAAGQAHLSKIPTAASASPSQPAAAQDAALAAANELLDKAGFAPSGSGRENIVGAETDDAIDALDRRVEFKMPAC